MSQLTHTEASVVAIKVKKPRKIRQKQPPLPSPTPEPGAFDLLEFCGWARISRTTAYEEIKSGRLIVRRIGSKPLITIEEAKAWFARLPTTRCA